MSKRKTGLGRGLSALIPNAQATPSFLRSQNLSGTESESAASATESFSTVSGGTPSDNAAVDTEQSGLAGILRQSKKSTAATVGADQPEPSGLAAIIGRSDRKELATKPASSGISAVSVSSVDTDVSKARKEKQTSPKPTKATVDSRSGSVVAAPAAVTKTGDQAVSSEYSSRPSDVFFASGGSGSVMRGGSAADLLMPRKAKKNATSGLKAAVTTDSAFGNVASAVDATTAGGANSSVTTPGSSVAATDRRAKGMSSAGKGKKSSKKKNVSRETISAEAPETELVPVPGVSLTLLAPSDIVPNPKQPRTIFDEDEIEELAASLKEVGVLQPVVVRVSPGHEGKFELIMGERRWRASQLAELEQIPAIIRETSDDDLLRDALLENLHRVALNPLEEAAAYQQLMEDFGCTQAQLALKVARSRTQIANTIRLLRLPGSIQNRVAAGILSAGHARAILALTSAEDQEYLAKRIVGEGLSVRATEEIVSLGNVRGTPRKSSTKAKGRGVALPDHYQDAIEHWSDTLDTKVTIRPGKKSSKLLIEFVDDEDLERLTKLLAYLPKTD